ncbi:hypothetical protein [Marinomonas primoryensis]|jgi:hypothetical protein|uniref:hypothetical protein n=1 Tax=Marinomonas primoryensis TaxID=178399 RepID=UPI003703B6B5
MNKLLIAFALLIAFSAYMAKTQKDPDYLDYFSTKDLCKATIATTMSRDPSIMKIDAEYEGIVYLSYLSDDLSKKWEFKCKIEGNKSIWASLKGRWRDDKLDSKITFKGDDFHLTINEIYPDNSTVIKKYTKSDLNKKTFIPYKLNN